MEKHRCKACSYIHTGLTAPDVCPKCGAPKSQFELLDANMSALLERASVTNDLYAEIIVTINKMRDLSEKGIKENLDPSCLFIFNKINDFSLVVKSMVLAEIQTHTAKSKWG